MTNLNQDFPRFMDEGPREIVDAGIAVNRALKRANKAREQVSLWREEQGNAETDLDLKEKEYGSLSLRWDVENKKIDPKLETLTR